MSAPLADQLRDRIDQAAQAHKAIVAAAHQAAQDAVAARDQAQAPAPDATTGAPHD